MTNYRGPNRGRIQGQQSAIFEHGGHVVTWRRYVSASAGVPGAGIGSAPRYVERMITALFYPLELTEGQRAAGLIVTSEFKATTRETLGRQDELVWQGETYRVESEATPAPMPGTFVSVIKRGKA
jgi:hypothetical protein